jgi:hypothetical protein
MPQMPITKQDRFVQPHDPLANVGGYHWGATANLASILQHGLLSYNQVHARQIKHIDLSLAEVQSRRANLTLFRGGPPLHDYANLCWHPRNPALLKVVTKPGVSPDELVVLEFGIGTLGLPNVRAVAKHAASGILPYRNAHHGQVWWAREQHRQAIQESFPEWDLSSWRGGGVDMWGEPTDTNKQKMNLLQAEVLVPNAIPSRFVERVYVRSEAAVHFVQEQIDQAVLAGWESRVIPLVVCGHLFFESW